MSKEWNWQEDVEKAVKKFNKHKGFAVIYYNAASGKIRCISDSEDNLELMYPENRYDVIVGYKCCVHGNDQTKPEYVFKKITAHRRSVAFPRVPVDQIFR